MFPSIYLTDNNFKHIIVRKINLVFLLVHLKIKVMSQVTIYNHVSNIYKKQDTTLLAVLLCIKKGTWGYQFENLKNITEEYRAIDDAKKKAEYKKTNFPGFTPSGIFRKRLDNELIKHSGIVH